MDTTNYIQLRELTRTIMETSKYSIEKANPALLKNQFFNKAHNICMLTHEYEANLAGVHSHDFFEINYVVSGHCKQQIESDSDILLNAGSVCILNPSARHSCRISSSVSDIVINLMFRPAFFNHAFFSLLSSDKNLNHFYLGTLMSTPANANYLLFSNSPNTKVDTIINHMVEEYLSDSPYMEINIRCYLILLFSELLLTSSQKAVLSQDSRIDDITNYIACNLSSATLKSVAEHFHLHPNYLSSLFREKTGKSFSEALIELKLTRAKYLITTSDTPLFEIGEELGYSDYSSFNAMFRKRTGYTPSAFKRLNMKSHEN